MKIDHLAGTQLPIGRGANALSFAGDGDFASKLTLGQIIKGRVLRSYEGGRHLVDFSGQQKVVDSAVPLRPDEVIVGRVVGLGERVELQRINTGPPPAPAGTAAAPATPIGVRAALAGGGRAANAIAGVFERFQAQLDPVQLGMLERAVARSAQPDAMAKSGLLLSKLGIPLSADALRAVFDALQRDPVGKAMFVLPDRAIHLETKAAETVTQAAVSPANAFAAVLSSVLNDLPETRARAGDVRRDGGQGRDGYPAFAAHGDNSRATRVAIPAEDAQPDVGVAGAPRSDAATTRRDGRADELPDVSRLILNVQSGGAIAHRVGTLPLIVDGRLVELNIALFEQAAPPDRDRSGARGAELRHRQVVFALTTEWLGRVEVRASVAGAHMRIEVDAGSQAASEFLAQHAAELTRALEGMGWHVDELAYRTNPGDGVVGRTVLEHLVAPGSVSTLA